MGNVPKGPDHLAEGMFLAKLSRLVLLVLSLMAAEGCSNDRDCRTGRRSPDHEEIEICIKSKVAGAYEGICTQEGAKKTEEFAAKECKPQEVAHEHFPGSESCQEAIRLAVNELCLEAMGDQEEKGGHGTVIVPIVLP
jgi:hypothetical protein